VWWTATSLAVIVMIVYVLTMSMQFDRNPFFYCQGAPAVAWISTWLSAYAITVLAVEPARILLMATIFHFWGDLVSIYRLGIGAVSMEMAEPTKEHHISEPEGTEDG